MCQLNKRTWGFTPICLPRLFTYPYIIPGTQKTVRLFDPCLGVCWWVPGRVHTPMGLHAIPLGADYLRVPGRLVWGRKVLSIHVQPPGGSTYGLLLESLYTVKGRLIHSAITFILLLASDESWNPKVTNTLTPRRHTWRITTAISTHTHTHTRSNTYAHINTSYKWRDTGYIIIAFTKKDIVISIVHGICSNIYSQL